MIKKTILFCLMVFFVHTTYAQEKYSKVAIDLNKYELAEITSQTGVIFDAGYQEKGVFYAEISSYDYQKLEAANIKFNVVIDDLTAYYQKRNKKFEGMSLDAIMRSSAKSYPIPEGFELGSMGGFHTTEEVYEELDSLRAAFPTLISAKTQVGTFTTHEGRELYWVRISDNPDVDEDEPEVLYTSLTHAREGNGLQAILYFMNYILEEYNDNPEIQMLIDNTEMYFIPVVNPDGYTYNETTNPNGGGMWRKNRRDNGSGSWGVDLNRNYGYNWGYDNQGSSPDPNDQTYRGPSAFSEPEIQAVKWFCEQHEFQLCLNYHTYSNLLVYPWGYEADHYTPDSALYVELAKVLTQENNYLYGTGNQTVNYVTNGDACDWMYGEQVTKNKILAFTPEVGSTSDGFWPSIDRIVPLCEENMWANIMLAKFAGAYASVEDLSYNLIGEINPYIPYNFKRLGLQDGATYEVSFIPASANVTSAAGAKTYIDPAIMDPTLDSIQLNLDPGIVSGDQFSFVIAIDNGSYVTYDTITKTYGQVTLIINDPCNDLTNWTSPQWNTTTSAYHSSPASITDSPSGNYSSDENNPITSANALDLSAYTYAELVYWAKWNIENDWDYAQVMISSDNGSTWNVLEGEYTNPGTGDFQPNGEPLYDASSDWVMETINISEHLSSQVLIRFELHSDGMIEEDGFYFDDLQIFGAGSSGDLPVEVVNPIEDMGFAHNAPNHNIDLSLVFHDPNGDEITYTLLSNSNTDIVDATINEETLTLDFAEGSEGISNIEIEAEANGTTATDEFTLSVGPEGISASNISMISINPNPATDYIKINTDSPIEKIIIRDIYGKIVTTIQNQNHININELSNGIYFIEIESTNNHKFISKFIKE